ncbi:carcinoembryonic antigen-related cell adhesion molecule 1-like [Myotis lucifugus]|uniref:carcinoembryonic antigen-related cell adhesion molecule 1-like n=1 Tax=Myotis lucifugus TaxID=59463 RepID=UPI0003C488E5|nr:carcinoembryonic antigen-related cell adhesion molecule 1-like [Myotis lucifugus]
MPLNARGFMGYRGEGANYKHKIARLGLFPGHRTGPAYSGQEQINFDGSLQLQRLTQNDTGIYIVLLYIPSILKEIGFERLNVYEPLILPTLLASNTTVTEHKDSVVLTCHTNAVSIQWFFNGMNLWLTERMKLSWNDRTLTIDPVRREDAGKYHCVASNPIVTAAKRLRAPTLLASNTTVMEHKDSVVLICGTNAVSIQWFFNGMTLWLTERMKLSWNDRILTIDPIRREDAGNYQCEVSNPISSAEKLTRVPTLLESNITVTGHENTVVLNCYSTVILTQWFFNNMGL